MLVTHVNINDFTHVHTYIQSNTQCNHQSVTTTYISKDNLTAIEHVIHCHNQMETSFLYEVQVLCPYYCKEGLPLCDGSVFS